MFSATLVLLYYFINRTLAYNSTYALSPELQQQVLDEHNRLRALHVDTPPLVWNDVVAGFAQDWAAQYDCSGILTHSEKPYGENLAIGYTAIDAIDTWYNEIRFYNYSNPGYSEIVGHFTQMVWKDSSRLGCAIRDCHNEWTTYFVCEYDPPGNYIGYFGQEVMPLKSSLISHSSSSSLITSSSSTSTLSTPSLSTISNIVNSPVQTTLSTVTHSSSSSVESTESQILGLVDSEDTISSLLPNIAPVSLSHSSIGKPQPTVMPLDVSSASALAIPVSSPVVTSSSSTISSFTTTSSSTSFSTSSSRSSSSSTLLYTSGESVSSFISSFTSQVTSSFTQINIRTSLSSNSADQISGVSAEIKTSNLDALLIVQLPTSTSTNTVRLSTSTSEANTLPEASTADQDPNSVSPESAYLLLSKAAGISSSSQTVASVPTTSGLQTSTSSDELNTISQIAGNLPADFTSSPIENSFLPNAATCSNSTESAYSTSVTVSPNASTISEGSSFVANNIISKSSTSSPYNIKFSSVVTISHTSTDLTTTYPLSTVLSDEGAALPNATSPSSLSGLPLARMNPSNDDFSIHTTTSKLITSLAVVAQSNSTSMPIISTILSKVASSVNNQNAIDALARPLNGDFTLVSTTTSNTTPYDIATATDFSNLIQNITTCNLNGLAVNCTVITVSHTDDEIITAIPSLISENPQVINARIGQQNEATSIHGTINRVETLTVTAEGTTMAVTSTTPEVATISKNSEYESNISAEYTQMTTTRNNAIEQDTASKTKQGSVTETFTERITHVNSVTYTNIVATLQSNTEPSVVSFTEATNSVEQDIDAIYRSGTSFTGSTGSITTRTSTRQTQVQDTEPSDSGSAHTSIGNISGNTPHSTNIISHYEGGGTNHIFDFTSLFYSAAIFILLF
ncbi:hypothetical protein C6P45_001092 [Maudiozyma exigua]|uniref:SCP domain-containing protein n=1 Tax=Maudiozyma exigua TaxID=34358 RepID=A0A9P7B744_MAUEX|nr:hypothetical protein C6P45_001092 [Kazachstania exigua]